MTVNQCDCNYSSYVGYISRQNLKIHMFHIQYRGQISSQIINSDFDITFLGYPCKVHV